MDSLRGHNQSDGEDVYENDAIEAPPAISADERRMHVRAYNYWVSLLGARVLPSIEDLNPEEMEDFSANSVLLDFSLGMENPAILYLGSALREECDVTGTIERINEVPPRSLLSRLTDHYLQIIANAAPVGFEAEFTNQRGQDIMYRGILMPFSSDDETIDFIYGVINWKEVASDSMVARLGEEMQAALDSAPQPDTVPEIWADGPSATSDFEDGDDEEETGAVQALAEGDFGFDETDDVLDLVVEAPEVAVDAPYHEAESDRLSATDSEGSVSLSSMQDDDDDDDDLIVGELDLSEFLAADTEDNLIADVFAGFAGEGNDTGQDDAAGDDGGTDRIVAILAEQSSGDGGDADTAPARDMMDEPGADGEGQGDLELALSVARRSASEVRECEARSRAALYRAIGDAYDFVLSAQEAPEAYTVMLEAAGIAVQDRSPMTAIIKLIFGADYDKTRVAEYALALHYGFAAKLPRGALADELAAYAGGLKGLVQDIRAARRNEDAAPQSSAVRRLDRAVCKLGGAAPVDAARLPFGDTGLAVVIARREADGTISLIGGVDLSDASAQKVMIAASKAL